ncbi:helix-turn-helix domain-containing protein [Peptostreptococcus russellii]|uniref:helix-turn-helix domain-containing protein n=1 Tax=Peptostreptococcus russellii TaxID=215200 RepID=UPI002942A776|nr:XRE family transcriptional regulator [Peptostreptococcus russellii]
MKDPTDKIGVLLRKVRQDKGLTLEETSKITDVSKAMLGQIERGESKPTISILWKISTGLKISISELLEDENAQLEVININEITPVSELDGKVKLYNVFPFDPNTGFESFLMTLEPGGYRLSKPHKSSSQEYLIVTEGELDLIISGETFKLRAPSAIKFNADIQHEYRNTSNKKTTFQNIIKYK